MLRLFGVLVLCAFVLGCRSRIKGDPGTQVVKKGVIAIWVGWVKDKHDKFDLNLNIQNDSPDVPMIIFLRDMTCHRGSVMGRIRHTFFNTGERTIDFRPREIKSFNMVCDTTTDQTGDFSVQIRQVWDNPSGDGKTQGKVIAENLEWRQSDKR